MKKFFIFGAVAIVLSFAVALGVKSYRTTHNTLFYANLDALANPEDDNGDGGDGGSNPGGGGTSPGEGGTNPGGGESGESSCRSLGLTTGLWNMALICADGGTNTVTCEVTGKISFLGITIEGSYNQGVVYTVAWERWACTASMGNCCDGSQQGIRRVS